MQGRYYTIQPPWLFKASLAFLTELFLKKFEDPSAQTKVQNRFIHSTCLYLLNITRLLSNAKPY